jgi:CYTH domain-containing protein
MPAEIERKFLLCARPDLPQPHTWADLCQGYLSTGNPEIRLRGMTPGDGGAPTFVRTVKHGTGLRREESEEPLDADTFAREWPRTAGARLHKRRYTVTEGGLRWEIDEYTDRDLIVAEVELPATDTAFSLPPWLEAVLVREVTGEPEFANKNLAR